MAALAGIFRPIWPDAVLMSEPLPGNAEIVLQLSLPDTAGHDSGGVRIPFEERMLALFDELREPLLRYLLSLRLTPERSEEILQDAFLKLFEHLKSFRSDSNIRGWLFRVAHNLALRDLRGRRYEALAGGFEPKLGCKFRGFLRLLPYAWFCWAMEHSMESSLCQRFHLVPSCNRHQTDTKTPSLWMQGKNSRS